MKLKKFILCCVIVSGIAQKSYAMEGLSDRFSLSLPSPFTLGSIGLATASPAILSYMQGKNISCPYSYLMPAIIAAGAGAWLNSGSDGQGALGGSLRWGILPLLAGFYYVKQQWDQEKAAYSKASSKRSQTRFFAKSGEVSSCDTISYNRQRMALNTYVRYVYKYDPNIQGYNLNIHEKYDDKIFKEIWRQETNAQQLVEDIKMLIKKLQDGNLESEFNDALAEVRKQG